MAPKFSKTYYIEYLNNNLTSKNVPLAIKSIIVKYITYGKIKCGNYDCQCKYKIDSYDNGLFMKGQKYSYQYIYKYQLFYKHYIPYFLYIDLSFEKYYCVKCIVKKNLGIILLSFGIFSITPVQAIGFHNYSNTIYPLAYEVINSICAYCKTFQDMRYHENYYKCEKCSVLLCKKRKKCFNHKYKNKLLNLHKLHSIN